MPTITFSEFPLGTTNPSFSFTNNTITTSGEIVVDGAQPDTPAVAANARYQGPVFVYFEEPVESATFDAGFFNNVESTRIEFRNANGSVFQSTLNDSTGVLPFSAEDKQDGIGAVAVIDQSFDAAGFSLDTLEFGAPVATAEPPLIDDENQFDLTFEREFTIEPGATLIFSGALGPGDQRDDYRLVVDNDGEALVSTWLTDRPGEQRTKTVNLEAGENFLNINIEEPYEDFRDYTVSLDFTPDVSMDEEEVNDFIDDTLAAFLVGGLSIEQFKTDFARIVAQNAGSTDEALSILGKLSKGIGVAGYLFDAANRADNIRAADEPARQLFIEGNDFLASVGATLGGGGIGAFVGGVGAPVGALGGALVYTGFVSGAVREEAGEFYDEFITGQPSENQLQMVQTAPAEDGVALALAADVASPAPAQPQRPLDLTSVTFDPDYYGEQHPDALEAVSSGRVPSLFAWYLDKGLQAGHKPNPEADPIDPADIAFDITQFDSTAAYNVGIFDIAAAAYAGDELSNAEVAVADYINKQRTSGTGLSNNDDLNVIANRVARDWLVNSTENPLNASAGRTADEWAGTLSTGEVFVSALSSVPGVDLPRSNGQLSGLSILATVTEATAPEKLFERFTNGPEAAEQLLGFDTESIGIGQFGGVWVAVLSTDNLTDNATVDSTPVPAFLTRDDSGEILFAGDNAARYELRAGADEFVGGAFNDDVSAGAGADILGMAGGDDVVNSGLGEDRITTGDGSDVVEGRLRSFDGDTITDFSSEDLIQINGVEFTAENINVSKNASRIEIDEDGDGSIGAAFAVEKETENKTFDVRAKNGNTEIRLVDDAEPEVNEVRGTDGRDNLRGTDGPDQMISLGGSYDRMAGSGGADEFIFGAEATNGVRERDVISNFDVAKDSIVLRDGASIAESRERDDTVVLSLDDGNDVAYIRGDGVSLDTVNIVDENLLV